MMSSLLELCPAASPGIKNGFQSGVQEFCRCDLSWAVFGKSWVEPERDTEHDIEMAVPLLIYNILTHLSSGRP